MTPACKLLKQKKIAYSVHEYTHDPKEKSFGLEAAQKLNLAVEHVFKTLLVTDETQYYVAILPVHQQLNLKKLAQVLKCKKIHLADTKQAERLTGYLVGGISPIGQKKQLKTILDESAKQYKKIYVSGGKRGFDIGINPQDLIDLLGITCAQIGE